MATLIDSCVILDLFTQDPVWYQWSFKEFSRAVERGPIVINPVLYAEISVRFTSVQALEARFPARFYRFDPIPREAAFMAGKCFQKYRKHGGKQLLPLPDFFIGAHAAVAKLPLLTRDPKRFRQHFPSVTLLTPE